MRIYDFSSESLKLYVCGDIHGEFDALICTLEQLEVENAVVIVAGDCGIGFEAEEYYHHLYNSIEQNLIKGNNILLFVRGNHDDPAYFDGMKIDFDRMKCIPDYSIVHVSGYNVLCIGGAVSIDRMPRLSEMAMAYIRGNKMCPTYWENEVVHFNEAAMSEIRAIKIDTVITHTSPSCCNITKTLNIDNFLAADEDLRTDLRTEKRIMDQIYHRLLADHHPLQAWYYGHYHSSQTEFINNIKFCLLDVYEIKEV